MPLRVTIFNEFHHEQHNPRIRAIYPEGIHQALARGLQPFHPQAEIQTATQDQPENGLTDPVLANTDVLLWWGHWLHDQIPDALADKVHQKVLEGMGILFLHSAHYSKPFKKLMGTGCGLKWRDSGERERLFIVNPAHEIADGLPPHIELPNEEMYGEFFDVPTPESLIMISWFQGGNVFRSLCTWTRGKGRVAYFRPGHETFPTYHNPLIQRAIANTVQWCAAKSSHPFSLGAPHEPAPPSPLT